MKKLAPRLSNKRGSMLMLTLIVFMVILILGMTMITSMLYSQGENNMQINEQKAYYAAFSAVEAVKNYFLNPKLNVSDRTSITSPYDLIDKTCTYSLEGQEIDEDTTVEISISRAENDSEYILIQATGRCNGEESVVTAKMREEVQKGSTGGLYSSKVVLAANSLSAYNSNNKITVKGNMFLGNMFLDDITVSERKSDMAGFDFTETDNGEDSTLFIRSEKDVGLYNSKFKNIFIQFKNSMEIKGNEQIDNIYVQQLEKNNQEWVSINIHDNKEVRGNIQFFSDYKSPSIQRNKIGGTIITRVPTAPSDTLPDNIVDEIYIQGAQSIQQIWNNTGHIIKNLYTDCVNISPQPGVTNIKNLTQEHLSFILNAENTVTSTMNNLNEISEVLRSKTPWSTPDKSSGFIKLEEVTAPYWNGFKAEEYYNQEKGIRLVFLKPDQNNSIYIHAGSYTGPDPGSGIYYISSENEDEQIFLISESDSITFLFDKKSNSQESEKTKFNNVYIYAPNSEIHFKSDFKYFKGSIIAKYIIINGIQGTFIFEEPTIIDGMGIPGGTDSTGSSSGTSSSGSTTYTYHFEEYIESDNN